MGPGHASRLQGLIKGHQGAVKLPLDWNDEDRNRSDENDRTPLGCAALKEHEGSVRLLVLLDQKSVGHNDPGAGDQTPLRCVINI